MIRSLAIAKTGLEAQQTNLDVISNNLANTQSTGFKRSIAHTTDIGYQAGLTAPVGVNGADVERHLPDAHRHIRALSGSDGGRKLWLWWLSGRPPANKLGSGTASGVRGVSRWQPWPRILGAGGCHQRVGCGGACDRRYITNHSNGYIANCEHR